MGCPFKRSRRAVAPTGKLVRIRYKRNVTALHTVTGRNTRRSYGRHRGGDTFLVDQADLPDARFEITEDQPVQPVKASASKSADGTPVVTGETSVGTVYASGALESGDSKKPVQAATRDEIWILAKQIGVNTGVARALCAAGYCCKMRLRGVPVARLIKIRGIGEKTARKIVAWANS